MQPYILRTKLKPPRVAPDILPRARLLDMLNEGRRRTLTLISAPAGCGDIVVKTPFGRLVAILIGLVGILFTGLMVAALVLAVRDSYEEAKNID